MLTRFYLARFYEFARTHFAINAGDEIFGGSPPTRPAECLRRIKDEKML